MSTRSHEPRLLTTNGEFHTIRRQLDRLAEAGVDIVKVAARPVDTLAERLVRHLTERVACVLVSSVLFETAEIVPHLSGLAAACDRSGSSLVVDAYHHLNVVPFDVNDMGLSRAFVVGGGYKYCQLGEGNCFLRVPAGCELRPVITGWFSEFSELAAPNQAAHVQYGRGAARFAGATYDPTSHYRAAAVFRFHQELGLIPTRLREISQHQTTLLESALRALDIDSQGADIVGMPHDRRAGFVTARTPHAMQVVRDLRARGVFVDARGAMLRLGPAPYVTDQQLEAAAVLVNEVIRNPKV
jgi:kynureninase